MFSGDNLIHINAKDFMEGKQSIEHIKINVSGYIGKSDNVIDWIDFRGIPEGERSSVRSEIRSQVRELMRELDGIEQLSAKDYLDGKISDHDVVAHLGMKLVEHRDTFDLVSYFSYEGIDNTEDSLKAHSNIFGLLYESQKRILEVRLAEKTITDTDEYVQKIRGMISSITDRFSTYNVDVQIPNFFFGEDRQIDETLPELKQAKKEFVDSLLKNGHKKSYGTVIQLHPDSERQRGFNSIFNDEEIATHRSVECYGTFRIFDLPTLLNVALSQLKVDYRKEELFTELVRYNTVTKTLCGDPAYLRGKDFALVKNKLNSCRLVGEALGIENVEEIIDNAATEAALYCIDSKDERMHGNMDIYLWALGKGRGVDFKEDKEIRDLAWEKVVKEDASPSYMINAFEFFGFEGKAGNHQIKRKAFVGRVEELEQLLNNPKINPDWVGDQMLNALTFAVDNKVGTPQERAYAKNISLKAGEPNYKIENIM